MAMTRGFGEELKTPRGTDPAPAGPRQWHDQLTEITNYGRSAKRAVL
jgi:hypothetical protein